MELVLQRDADDQLGDDVDGGDDEHVPEVDARERVDTALVERDAEDRREERAAKRDAGTLQLVTALLLLVRPGASEVVPRNRPTERGQQHEPDRDQAEDERNERAEAGLAHGARGLLGGALGGHRRAQKRRRDQADSDLAELPGRRRRCALGELEGCSRHRLHKRRNSSEGPACAAALRRRVARHM
ncbi:hypothetical protein AMR74_16725 [Halorubrum tropicale]|uniref:Uncharacterized protein n=1 Tax=Halorubrum tropicale TaxID=1765655 RepID=A0A0N0BNM6_9EURY|nr:hypothetical protein AMR74_16725 [Halorubrum tropicale]